MWDGPANNNPCSANVAIQHKFTLPCLGQDLTVYATADDNFTISINGVTGSTPLGTDWQTINSHTVSTTGINCGTIY